MPTSTAQQTKVKSFESILLSSLDEKLFFRNLGYAIKENFTCDRVIIFKSIDDGSPIFVSDSECLDALPYVLEKGKGVSGHVIRTSRPYYSNNMARDPLCCEEKEGLGYNAELCVPIIIAGQIMATVHLQNKTNNHHFSQKDINQVKEFLNHLDRPLRNMKMYLTAKHLNRTLKEEVQQKERELKEKSQGVIEGSLYCVHDFEIIGQCPKINEIRNMVQKFSYSSTPILIEGESGVGKESIAKKIHVQTCGKDKPFVVVNASILTEDTFEREMFGYVKGAFLGSNSPKEGFCRVAHEGTLFLDNVGQLSPSMQIKILRFLENKKVYKIGSQKGIEVDVRVIVSFNGNLQKEVEAGRFREDLYFMLKGFAISIPALREREGDIGLLANFFLNENKSPMDHKQLSPEALTVIKGYNWPGNVRELKNMMERAYLMSEEKTIRVHHLPTDVLSCEEVMEQQEIYTEMTLEKLEKKHILRTLEFMKNNKTKTAKTLGITVKTLYNKLHNYGVIRSRS